MARMARWVSLMISLAVLLPACSDPTDPREPRGRIVVDPQPDTIDAPWLMIGPAGFTLLGSGSMEMSDMQTGRYTLTWGHVTGWRTPGGTTQTLDEDVIVTFTALYDEDEEDPLDFVYVPPGEFTMGSPSAEPGRFADREREHPVTLTRGFYISPYEVTEEWWFEIMGGNPATPNMPKTNVSWYDAVAFCNALSSLQGLTPVYAIEEPGGDVIWNRELDGYRLPTEAEWEYACRAGSPEAFWNGPLLHLGCEPLDPSLDQIGWYCGNSEDVPQVVGQLSANLWGLYDMHGNVREWVWDRWRWDYHVLPQVDPVFDGMPDEIGTRVLRGGSWKSDARYCRSAYRSAVNPNLVHETSGFRVVRSAF